MNKNMLVYGAICAFFLCCCAGKEQRASSNVRNDSVYAMRNDDVVEIPLGVQALLHAYPDFVVGYEEGNLLLSDGSKLLYDDRQTKTFEEKLDKADPEDMFGFKYEIKASEPDYLQDAGRSRCEQLFKFMYGSNENEVRKNLVKVDWFGDRVVFTKINGAADSLRSVAKEIGKYPELQPYLRSGGTFYWRKVRGANRQSAHSYGIAIDVGVSYSDYWLWKNKGKKETDRIRYANRMPQLLINIFEKHGFIWGGRWYHFDTMHFEFRPEILYGCVDR